MKEFRKSWKFWAAVAALVLLIAAIVLWFTCPRFCYAVSGMLIGGLGGFIGGWYAARKNPVVAPKAQPKEEKPKAVEVKSNKPKWP